MVNKFSEMPCKLVYRKANGEFEVLPILDRSRINKLCCIECAEVWVCLKNSGFGDMDDAIKGEEDLGNGWKKGLIDGVDLNYIYLLKDAFAATVSILKSLSVDADHWLKGWYWSETHKEPSHYLAFDMRKGFFELTDRTNSNGFIRYCYKRV